MHSLLLCVAVVLTSVAASQVEFPYNLPPTAACSILKAIYPNNKLLPVDAGYVNETQLSWDTSACLDPACVFAPSTSAQMSVAISTLATLRTKFAMRGGGHMPISTAANINSSGVLLSSTNLIQLRLLADRQTVSPGPGNTWGKVYEYLDGTGLSVLGGRLGPIGVPGLLLGGGISFYGNEYGFASSNGYIRAYECVLANGRVVTTTERNRYSGLYWALRGDENSFCIVTRFDLKPIDAPNTMLTDATYGNGTMVKKQWIDSIYNFVMQVHKDTKAAIIPVARFGSGYCTSRPKEALNIVHDTLFAGVEAQLANGIGYPQRPVEIPTFWTEQSISWSRAEDDAILEHFKSSVNAEINAKLEVIKATSAYLYLSDASENQAVFQSYPPENLARLKAIRSKYDPTMVFTKLMPGGFKVANA
ncbi:uncharacterized protein PAC_18421 [Phialocephala subalpina]|uniref:FAD-binding PCMH-type domain-containing protein n=1 Tax=Phialocephala subalpina TaxID=576137 RepID=A0A1L7XU16_9HELO|nr:uncharacterized protein PAC_18421 [Phialocephala subalpina]